ncbi:MAG: S8 family serine peptidase, partial [Rhodospirillales bacterium]
MADETETGRTGVDGTGLFLSDGAISAKTFDLPDDDYSMMLSTHDIITEPTAVPQLGSANLWHLKNLSTGVDINIEGIWEDYTGAGVTTAIFDDGVDHNHSDLDDNYDFANDYDSYGNDSDALATGFDEHGTAVAGIMVAENNGTGAIGIAYDATLAGLRFSFGFGSISDINELIPRFRNFDVVNNSWGFTYSYGDDFNYYQFATTAQALEDAARYGRDGLGTSITWSAGNARTSNDDVNYHNQQNSRFTIAVGAIAHSGAVSYYSTPGAAILVSAPSSGEGYGIYTTDRVGSAGYSSSDYTSSFGGTSAAAPVVAGVVALMYEANPLLGYRDVQEILALSANRSKISQSGWQLNGAGNWNGGGMFVSHDFGHGLVDAHAAIRLAQTWTAQSTLANEDVITYDGTGFGRIGSNTTVTRTASVPGSLDFDHIEVEVDFSFSGSPYQSNFELVLTSSSGASAVLSDGDTANYYSASTWTYSTTHFWGEDSAGDWTLSFREAGSSVISITDFSISFYGDVTTGDNFVYTEDFSDYYDASRATIGDSDGGDDTLNAAAITSDLILDLNAGAVSTIDGHAVTMDLT